MGGACMLDSLIDGRRRRMLTVVDIFSRFSPIFEAGRSLNGHEVVMAPERATRRYSCPELVQVDNGSEFQSKALDASEYAHRVKLDFITPGIAWTIVLSSLSMDVYGTGPECQRVCAIG
jgi:putative transposase